MMSHATFLDTAASASSRKSRGARDTESITRATPYEIQHFSWVTGLWAVWFLISLVQTKVNRFLPNQEKYLLYLVVVTVILSWLELRGEKRQYRESCPALVLWITVVALALITHSMSAVSNSTLLTILMLLDWTLPSRRKSSCRILVGLAEMCLFAGIVLVAVAPNFVFSQDLTRIVNGGSSYRFVGMGFHPNDAAPFALVTAIVLALRVERHILRRLAGLFAGILTVYMTESRVVWLVAAVLTVPVVVLMRTKHAPTRKQVIAGFLGLSVAGIAAVKVLLPAVTLGEANTKNGRSVIWQFVLDHWTEQPLFGHGPGAFVPLRGGSLPIWAWHAHNTFLQELFIRGLIGVGVLTFVLVAVVARGIKSFLTHPVLLLATLALLGTGYMNVVYAPEYLNLSTLGVLLTLGAYLQVKADSS